MFSGYICLSLALTVTYAAIMALYLYGWRRLPCWQIPPDFAPQTAVTVVIPARNEAQNIGACLQSVLDGSYPRHLLEILVVDDFSEDETGEIVLKMVENNPANIRLIRLADSSAPENIPAFGKKRAIQAAIAGARGELIVTTDADCMAPPDWLLLLISAYETRQPKAIVAPVMIHQERNLLHYFQALDVAGTMGITGAGIGLGWQRLGNGANLAYPKTAFEAVKGFAGDAQAASGDDLFLLQKIARHWPDGIIFLKNAAAAVCTPAAPDWRAFFQQRLRWGTKNAALPETPVRLVLAAVWLFCCTILLNTALVVFSPTLFWLFLIQVAVKAGADYLLLREMCGFFRRRDLLTWFWPSFLLHTVYIGIMGTASLFFRKFEWKKRIVE